MSTYTRTGLRMALILPYDALQIRSLNTVSATWAGCSSSLGLSRSTGTNLKLDIQHLQWLIHTHGIYHNDPKFLHKQVRANSVDPDQYAPRGVVDMRVFPVCCSTGIMWRYNTMVELLTLNFRVVTQKK